MATLIKRTRRFGPCKTTFRIGKSRGVKTPNVMVDYDVNALENDKTLLITLPPLQELAISIKSRLLEAEKEQGAVSPC